MIQTSVQEPEPLAGPKRPEVRDFSTEDSEENIGVTLTQFARRKRFIAAFTGLSGMLGVAVALLLPVRYNATTKIMTPQQTPSAASLMIGQATGSTGSTLAALAGNSLSLRNPNDAYTGLLNSRPVADAIINEFGLRDVYRTKDMTATRNELAVNTVTVSEKSGFLVVTVTDRDRQRAAAIANAYVMQLRILTKTMAATEASQRRQLNEEQLKSAKDDLVAAELKLKAVEQLKGVVEPDAQSKGLIAGLTDLQALAAAKQVEVRALQSYSTERSPDVQLAESQLASIQSEIRLLQQSKGAPTSAGLGLQSMAGGAMEYLSAAHELQYRQTLLDLLLRQYDAAKLDEAKEAVAIQVVEPAISPDRRSSPQRTSIVMTFAILGFLGACSYLYLCNFLRANPDLSRGLTQFRAALLER